MSTLTNPSNNKFCVHNTWYSICDGASIYSGRTSSASFRNHLLKNFVAFKDGKWKHCVSFIHHFLSVMGKMEFSRLEKRDRKGRMTAAAAAFAEDEAISPLEKPISRSRLAECCHNLWQKSPNLLPVMS